MYTPTITSKSFDRAKRQVILTVDFSDGTNTVTETLPFGADVSINDILRNLKLRASLLDEVETKEAAVPTGVIDLSTVPEDDQTAAEKAASDWLRNFERLQKVQLLIDLQVLTGNETAVQNLRTKVSTDFRPAYINLF